MQQLRSCPVQELPSSIYSKLHGLNFRKRGEMQEAIAGCRKGSPAVEYAEVAYIEDDDTILGWALIMKFKEQPIPVQHLYTRVKARGQRIGTQLAKYGKDKYNQIGGHDDTDIFTREGFQRLGYVPYYRYFNQD